MATGVLQEGENPTHTAPATVTAGTCVKVGDALVYPTISAASGAQFTGCVRGVVTHAKLSAQAWTEGQQVNWDDTNKRFTTVTTGNFRAGYAYRVANNPSATGQVMLYGVGLGTALAERRARRGHESWTTRTSRPTHRPPRRRSAACPRRRSPSPRAPSWHPSGAWWEGEPTGLMGILWWPIRRSASAPSSMRSPARWSTTRCTRKRGWPAIPCTGTVPAGV